MKSILLIGLGRFGRHIALKLTDMGHEVLAVDKSEERVSDALEFVTNGQIGDSTNTEFLSSLGVSNFDACIVAIGDDFQSSLETTWLLNELGAVKVISRASRGLQEKFLRRNGADLVVYPERQVAEWTAIRCTDEHILNYIELGNNFSIFEMMVPVEWDGKTVIELDIRRRYEINILGFRDGNELNMNITPDTCLYCSGSVLVLGREKQVRKCFHY